MDADDFRKAAHAAIEEIIQYNANIAEYPVLPTIKPGYLAPQLPTSAPQTSQPWSAIQSDIASKIVPGLTHWQSPNFMAFFPAGVTYPSLLGEMYCAAFTAPAFNWLCSPACTELETVVLDWMAKAMALPDCFLSSSPGGGGGVIQGSASEAVVTCMVAARERFLRTKCDMEGLAPGSPERDDRIAHLRGRLVALSSDQAHSSTQKGALIAGTRYRSIKTSWSTGLSLSGSELERALQECITEGLEPYFITTTLGTTSTCAIDDFASIASTLRSFSATHGLPQIWSHVDAAYAGAALVLPEFSSRFCPQFTDFDSFDMNMHKWLLVNFDASCLYVRNRNDLTVALSINPAYLQNKHTDSGLVTDYRDWQIPLGRRFRSLKIWFVMRSYGIEGMQAHLANSLKCGEVFESLVRGRNDLYEIVFGPAFGLVCFRVRPDLIATVRQGGTTSHANGSADPTSPAVVSARPSAVLINSSTPSLQEAEDIANTLTKQIAETINERGEIFITSSSTNGKSFIRVISANPNAQEKYVRSAFDKIVDATEDALAEFSRSHTK